MHYYTLNEYLQNTFGCKVYKLSLSLGTTCPNRDGTVGVGGCIFCSERGSGDFAENVTLSITEQIEKAKQRVGSKIKSNKYIAYFQSFTSTYVSYNSLEKALNEAVGHPDIVAVSVATRPDCLTDEAIELMKELNKTKPVWVELGLQTIHKSTADYIRRGYGLSVFDDAVKRLKGADLKVIVHMIIGLPNETEEMIFETASYIGNSGADGVKLQLLHILENTDIAKDYLSKKFRLPSLEEYARTIAGCIKRLPPDTVIHRITGDGSKCELIAPLWSADKKLTYQYLLDYFREIELTQGELFTRF